jgi:SAM-dependent methyltransferase
VGTFDFDQVFGDDYLHFYEAMLSDERTDREADVLLRLLALEPGAHVLDIPCGHGRMSRRLSGAGFRVVGVDSNPRFLEVARRAAHDVEYVEADMRTFDPQPGFDAIVNWFTSFGYFDEATDRGLLARWRRALKDGGKLVIDHQNRERLFALLAASGGQATVLTERGDDLMIDRTTFDVQTARTDTERIAVRGGRVRRYHFSVRTFAFNELRDWLLEAGFRSVSAFGNDGEPFSLASRRMIVVAEA